VGQERFRILVVDSGSTQDANRDLTDIVATHANADMIVLDQPGVSLARNAGATACGTGYIAYIDDDAVPAADWIEQIIAAIRTASPPPAVIGGRILPQWEAPLPRWWPASLKGVLSIIETEGRGEYRTAELPHGLEPYGVNITFDVAALLAAGGFGTSAGRRGTVLLSDEEVQLAWRLQAAGMSARYESRILVHHSIQAPRLSPDWLLSRLYWQGASTVMTRRLLGHPGAVWRELPRRLIVALLCAPAAMCRRDSTRWIAPRWRFAYAAGFIRAAFGCRLGRGT
jgi:glycosyltransferase involved in cell wall biosynthesis